MMPEDKPEIHNGILNMTPEEILANNSDDNIYRVLFSADPFDTSYNYTRDLPLFNKSTDTEVFQPSIIDDPLLQRWIDSIKKLPKLKPNQVVILDSYTPEFLKMRSRRYGEMTAFDPITGHFNPPYEGWRPYCLKCITMDRMTPTDYGWKCDSCSNPIGRDLMHWNGSECPTTQESTVDDTV
jgi:hypothetical protein